MLYRLSTTARSAVRRARQWLGGSARLGLLLACLWISPGLADTRVFSDPEYLIDLWETEQGLPQPSATAMVQGPDGYLWFGTFGGLVRFDGLRFTTFNKLNTPELPNNAIVSVHLDHAGRLWASTYEGTACLKDGQWTVHRPGQGWPSKPARLFVESSAGELFATTFAGDVLRYNGADFEALPPPPADASRGVMPHLDEQGILWVVCPSFIGRLVEGKWQETIPVATWKQERYQGAGSSRDQGLWILTKQRLRKYRGSQLVFDVAGPQKAFGVWRIFEDSTGTVWVCTMADGLYRFHPDSGWRHFTPANGLAHKNVRFVFEDREKNLWVGTDGGGLHRFRRRVFKSWGAAERLRVNTVCLDHQGRVLIGTNDQRVMHFDGTDLKPVYPGSAESRTPLSVLSLLSDRQDRLWLGARKFGLNRLEGEVFVKLALEPTQERMTVDALFEDSQGRIWIGTNRGISCFENGHLQTYHLEGGFQRPLIRCFAQDARTGALWAGGSVGLFRWQDDQFRRAREAGLRKEEEVNCLFSDPDGTLWIGTAHLGLACVRRGRTVLISEKEGLPAQSIGAVLDDGQGALWLSSERGIVRVPRQELENVLSDQSQGLVCQLFDTSDGLPTAECDASQQPSAAKDARGRLWFATAKGLVMTDPNQLQLNTMPPLLTFEKVLIDGQRVDGERPMMTSAPADPQPIVVPPGAKRIEIHYQALSFSMPEKVRYRYRLEGLDKAWIDVGNQRIAYLNDPKAGQYRFRVTAANNHGVWNEAGVSFALYVQPHFYQTNWFYALCACGVVLSGAGLHRLRVHRLRTRQQQLVRVVAERTKDLQAEIAERRRAEEKLREHQEHLEELVAERTQQIQGSLREKEALLKEVHHRVKNNLQIISSLLNLQAGQLQDPAALDILAESQNRVRSMALVHESLYQSGNLASIPLAPYIEGLCAHLHQCYGVDASRIVLTTRIAEATLDLDRASPCGLIINELVSNALKHAFPGDRTGRVLVELQRLPDQRYALLVSDNGIGLPEGLDPRQTDSLGLQLVNDLTHQLGGTIAVDRALGTTFTITFGTGDDEE